MTKAFLFIIIIKASVSQITLPHFSLYIKIVYLTKKTSKGKKSSVLYTDTHHYHPPSLFFPHIICLLEISTLSIPISLLFLSGEPFLIWWSFKQISLIRDSIFSFLVVLLYHLASIMAALVYIVLLLALAGRSSKLLCSKFVEIFCFFLFLDVKV